MSLHPSDDTAAAMEAAGLVPGQSPVPLRLPDPGRLFQARAGRLRQLAPGTTLEDWMGFVACLSDAQHLVAAQPARADSPEQQWRHDLAALLQQLAGQLPQTAEAARAALAGSSAVEQEALAGRIIGGQLEAADMIHAPFVMAALQLAWSRHAASLTPGSIAATATARACPVCGSAPVAGVIHSGGEVEGLRYLHCGLCHTAWHHVRATCVSCGDAKDLSYQSIDGQEGGAQAETCDGCRSYLKLLVEKKALGLDPIADDLASLALDILVSEENYQRIGINPFLLMGE